MQRKENNSRRVIEMEKGGGLGIGNMMEVELTEKIGNRITRPPLEDISGSVENVKRTKVEGEVMGLSKLMAQDLGSAAAAGQPCREQ